MGWFCAVVLGVAFVELLIQIPLGERVRLVAQTGRRSLAVIRSSRISDCWKEIALLSYARRMAVSSGVLAVVLLSFGAGGLVLVLIANAIGGGDPVQVFLLSPVGLLFTSAVSLSYFYIRRKLG